MARVIIYNTSREKVAYLPNAYNVGKNLRINELSTASFQIPIDDVHISECTLRRYAEIYDDNERVGLFRIVKKRTVRSQGDLYCHFDCEHVLATLQDDKASATLYGTVNTATSIGEVLAEQTTGNWVLGTCEFAETYLYEWKRGTSLLKALLDIPARFGAEYQFTFDTTSYPWTLNLVEPATAVTCYIDYSRNLEALTKEEDSGGAFYTRLYPHGAKAGEDQIDITSVEPSGHAYVDSAHLATYGDPIVKHWTDQRYTTAQGLYDAALAKIALEGTPRVVYTVQAADLYRLTEESIDHFTLGALVKVTDPDLSVDVNVRVVSLTKSSMGSAPGNITIELANKKLEFRDPNLVETNDLGDLDLANLPGGVVGSLPAVPSSAGLYVCTEYLGFHDGTTWKTYMDNVGKLYAQHDDCYFQFDPVAGTLNIKGAVTITGGSGIGNLTDAGDLAVLDVVGTAQISNLAVTDAKIDNLSVSKLTAGDLSVEMNLTTGGSVKSNNYAYHSAGWKIDNGGSAEFNDVYVRGTLNASDLTAGTLNFNSISRSGLTVLSAEIGSGAVTYGKIASNAVRTSELNIDGYLNMNTNNIWNCTEIRNGTALTQHAINLSSDYWVGYLSSTDSRLTLTRNASLRGHTDLTLDAQAGDLYLKGGDDILLYVADSSYALTIYDWTTTTGGNNSAGGSILIKIGSTLRRIKLWQT